MSMTNQDEQTRACTTSTTSDAVPNNEKFRKNNLKNKSFLEKENIYTCGSGKRTLEQVVMDNLEKLKNYYATPLSEQQRVEREVAQIPVTTYTKNVFTNYKTQCADRSSDGYSTEPEDLISSPQPVFTTVMLKDDDTWSADWSYEEHAIVQKYLIPSRQPVIATDILSKDDESGYDPVPIVSGGQWKRIKNGIRKFFRSIFCRGYATTRAERLSIEHFLPPY